MKKTTVKRIRTRWFHASLLVGFMLMLTLSGGHADVVTMNNGDEMFGEIQKADENLVGITVEGTFKTIPATDILKIEFDRFYGVKGETAPDEINDPIIKKALADPPTASTHPEARWVDLLDEEVIEVKPDGTFDRTFRRIFVVLQETARDEANHAFRYFPDQESFTLHHARSITPGQAGMLGFIGGTAGKVRNTSSRTVAEEVDFYVLPQYQRRRTVKFAVPEVGLGTIVDWKYTVSRTASDPLDPFYAHSIFQDFEPCLTRRLIVRLPAVATVAFDIAEAGVPVQHQVIKGGERIEHLFLATNVPGLRREPRMASPVRFVSQVRIAGKSFGEGSPTSGPETWKNIAETYQRALGRAGAAAATRDRIRKKVTEICGKSEESPPTEGARQADPIRKARLLFQFLAREITTVPVDPQDFSYQALEPDQILDLKQASVLDKVFLYHVFLEEAGVAHDLLMLRPLSAGAWVPGVPHRRQGTVLGIRLHGQPNLDPTDGARPLDGALPTDLFSYNVPWSEKYGLDMIPARLQGATGIVLGSGEPVTVPMDTPAQEEDRQTLEGILDAAGNLTIETLYRPQGTRAAGLRGLKDMTREQIRVMLETELAREFPGAALTDFSSEGLTDMEGPVGLRYAFRIEGFAMKSGDDLLVIPLPLEKSAYDSSEVGQPDRQTEMFWPTNHLISNHLTLKLPGGYSLYALPEGSWAEIPGMSYFSTFGWEKGTLTFRDRLRREIVSVSPKAYKAYKTLVETRSRTTDRWIVAVRRDSGTPTAAP